MNNDLIKNLNAAATERDEVYNKDYYTLVNKKREFFLHAPLLKPPFLRRPAFSLDGGLRASGHFHAAAGTAA
jgi:hypothetical protein